MKTIHYLLLAAGLCVLTSACDDESSEGARLTFEPALESLEFTTEGGSQTFLLYSNVPEWSIRCRYGDEWIDVWPAEGDFDGAVSLLRPIREDKRCLNTLATAYYRLGDKATALDLFKQAAAMGDKVAIQNLENIENDY